MPFTGGFLLAAGRACTESWVRRKSNCTHRTRNAWRRNSPDVSRLQATSLGQREVAALWLGGWYGRGLAGFVPGVAAVQVPRRYARIRVVDAKFVRHAHRLGMQVHVWTIDEPAEMHELLDLGVDGIMTDHIDTLRKVLEDRGSWV